MHEVLGSIPALQSANQSIKEAHGLLLIHAFLIISISNLQSLSRTWRVAAIKTAQKFLFKVASLLLSPPSLFSYFSFSRINPCQRLWKLGVWVPGWSEVTGKGGKTSICILQSLSAASLKRHSATFRRLSLKASAILIFWFSVTIEKLYNSSSGIRRCICNKNC